jgi:hypothetical protein
MRVNVWDVAPRDTAVDPEESESAAAPGVVTSEPSAGADFAEPGGEPGDVREDGPDASASAPSAEDEITPLGIEPPGESGDAVVDRAVQRLTQVDVLATEQHGEVYEDVHRELREVLSALDR